MEPQQAACYSHVQSSRAPSQSRQVPPARQKRRFVPPSGEISPSAITVHLSKTLARDRTTLLLLGGQWSVKIQPEPDHSSFPGRLYCGLPAKWQGSSIYSNWCVYCSLRVAPVLLLECSEKNEQRERLDTVMACDSVWHLRNSPKYQIAGHCSAERMMVLSNAENNLRAFFFFKWAALTKLKTKLGVKAASCLCYWCEKKASVQMRA